MTIWANTIVNNEENFIWFAVMSVIDYVDKILIWDTGSEDKTVAIIKEIKRVKGDKILFKEVGKTSKDEFSKLRQEMLNESSCDWILILDGDEVWWDRSIRKVVKFIDKNGKDYDSLVVPFYNAVGDIYHYQPKKAGKYRLIGREGHLTIRAVKRSIPGLHVGGSYGVEGFLDQDNIPIQDRNHKKIAFVDAPYLHLTHLKRSTIDSHHKFKYELGLKFPKNFNYPEIFKKERPSIVPKIVNGRNLLYELLSRLGLPYLIFKRNF